jgi:hypothetical protein
MLEVLDRGGEISGSQGYTADEKRSAHILAHGPALAVIPMAEITGGDDALAFGGLAGLVVTRAEISVQPVTPRAGDDFTPHPSEAFGGGAIKPLPALGAFKEQSGVTGGKVPVNQHIAGAGPCGTIDAPIKALAKEIEAGAALGIIAGVIAVGW